MAHALLIDQPSFEGFCPVADAVEKLAQDSGVDERGAVYTRREVVEFMLDLAGYDPSLPLKSHVGPSFGNNFNNRTEEAIGTSHDLFTAYREGVRPTRAAFCGVADGGGGRTRVSGHSTTEVTPLPGFP